jgi:exopolysaccharide biosynthesis polyprenyl glycosylphosphotransferase
MTLVSEELSHHTLGPVEQSVSPAEPLVVPDPDKAPGYRRNLARTLTTDVTALLVAGVVAWRLSLVPATFCLAVTVLVVFGLRLGDLYGRGSLRPALDQCGAVVLAVSSGALAASAVVGAEPRGAAGFSIFGIATLLAGRASLFCRDRRRAIANPVRVLIVGAGTAGQELAGRLLRHPEHGMVPVGFIDSSPEPLDPDLPLGITGGLDDLDTTVRRLGVERLVIDASAVAEDDVLGVLDQASRARLEIVVLPALAKHLSTAISCESLAGMTLLAYRRSERHGVSWAAKRAVDVTLALAALIIALPFMVATAIAIKFDSPGPVVYRQRRVGLGGREFTLYKFRSMTTDADQRRDELIAANEADGPYFKVSADPRCTRVGRFIRRYSIDELPQLVNVVRGSMSLVGPRPALPSEVAAYPHWFNRRLSVPPGLTGLWQVSGRFLLPFHEAARLDVFYADHWSFGLDLKILARTPAIVMSARGAR